MKKILLLFLIFSLWRLFLFLPLIIGYHYIPYQKANKDAQLWAYTRPYAPVNNYLLYPWANFDAVYYLTIAGDGYNRGAVGRFLPFYPMLISLVSTLAHGTTIYAATQFFSAFFIANICFFLSILMFYKLMRLDYSHGTSLWSILFLLSFPTSFYFGSIYSESVFFLLALVSLYLARSKHYLLASICGCFLTLTRIVGFTIIVSLFLEIIQRNTQKKSLKRIVIASIPLLLIPAGLLGYMYFNYLRWHDWIYFIHAQQAVVAGRTHLVPLFPQTIYRYVKILISLSPKQFEWWVSLLEISVFFIASFLLYMAVRLKIHTSYVLFSILSLIVPTFSGTFNGLPRYVSVLFPLFIVLGLIKNPIIKGTLLSASSILLFVLTMYFSRGYFIS